MSDVCGKMVYWWDGEYEGGCELPIDHEGPHFDGMSWYDDDNEEVPAPEEEEEHISVEEEIPAGDGETLLKTILEECVTITFSIQYPSSDGKHERSQGIASLKTKDVDLAGIDLVLYHAESLVRSVLNRYRDHKWASTVERCDKTAPEWSLARGYSCKLERGHEGRHVLDR